MLVLPPSVWVAGEMLTAYGGAIGVMCGEPVVYGPCADVAFIPSLTIALTFFFRASAMLTVSCTEVLPPLVTMRFVQVTVPLMFAPPLLAETNVVFAGTGSVSVTPVASALPMFLSVSV